jgi:hypothetical protein
VNLQIRTPSEPANDQAEKPQRGGRQDNCRDRADTARAWCDHGSHRGTRGALWTLRRLGLMVQLNQRATALNQTNLLKKNGGPYWDRTSDPCDVKAGVATQPYDFPVLGRTVNLRLRH